MGRSGRGRGRGEPLSVLCTAGMFLILGGSLFTVAVFSGYEAEFGLGNVGIARYLVVLAPFIGIVCIFFSPELTETRVQFFRRVKAGATDKYDGRRANNTIGILKIGEIYILGGGVPFLVVGMLMFVVIIIGVIGNLFVDPAALLNPDILIFLVIIVAFVVPCFVPTFIKSRENKLRERSRFMYAQIDGVEQNISVRVGGISPRVIHLSYRNAKDGQLYKFKSGNFWDNDPAEDIALAGLTKLPVYMDRKRPERYFVDTEAIYRNVVDLT